MLPRTLIPGEWYLILACPQCRRDQILPDPDKGVIVQGNTPCSDCRCLMPHDSKTTDRYLWPTDYIANPHEEPTLKELVQNSV